MNAFWTSAASKIFASGFHITIVYLFVCDSGVTSECQSILKQARGDNGGWDNRNRVVELTTALSAVS